jgi:hypothetical protein
MLRSIWIFQFKSMVWEWDAQKSIKMLYSQFYIQLVFKAPLCIKLTISDQKIVSGSLFLTQKKFLPIFFIFLSSNFLVRTLQCEKKY